MSISSYKSCLNGVKVIDVRNHWSLSWFGSRLCYFCDLWTDRWVFHQQKHVGSIMLIVSLDICTYFDQQINNMIVWEQRSPTAAWWTIHRIAGRSDRGDSGAWLSTTKSFTNFWLFALNIFRNKKRVKTFCTSHLHRWNIQYAQWLPPRVRVPSAAAAKIHQSSERSVLLLLVEYGFEMSNWQ